MRTSRRFDHKFVTSADSQSEGLLVDDQLAQLVGCRKLLSHLGILVDTATTFGEATVMTRSHQYRFALLDYATREGLTAPREFIRQLRNCSPGCRVYILTAYPDDARESLADLAVPIVGKPLGLDRLRQLVAPFMHGAADQQSRSNGAE